MRSFTETCKNQSWRSAVGLAASASPCSVGYSGASTCPGIKNFATRRTIRWSFCDLAGGWEWNEEEVAAIVKRFHRWGRTGIRSRKWSTQKIDAQVEQKVPYIITIDHKHLRFSPIERVNRISQICSRELDRKSMKELRRAIGLSFKCSLSLDGALYPDDAPCLNWLVFKCMF